MKIKFQKMKIKRLKKNSKNQNRLESKKIFFPKN